MTFSAQGCGCSKSKKQHTDTERHLYNRQKRQSSINGKRRQYMADGTCYAREC